MKVIPGTRLLFNVAEGLMLSFENPLHFHASTRHFEAF